MRMASLWPLGLEVIASLLPLWLSFIAFIACSVYYVYIYGQFLLIYGWYYICGFLLHLWVIQL